VNCRYTDRGRDEILRSRVETTALREAVAAASTPPRVWLNASTATIYRHRMDAPNTESTAKSARVLGRCRDELGARVPPAICPRRDAWRCGWRSCSATDRRPACSYGALESADPSSTVGGRSIAATAASGPADR
jgi:hypothetical protein